MDVLKYKDVISNVLKRLKVSKNHREDLTQECYLALLEKQHHLEHGEQIRDDLAFAASICRNRVIDVWRAEGRRVKTESLSAPRNYNAALQIAFPDAPKVTDEQLLEAILSLPYEEYMVVYSLFITGNTVEKTSEDRGLSVKEVRTKSKHGVAALKKYFEVE